MSPGGYDSASLPSSSTQHDVWRSHGSLSSPYDRSYAAPPRHRSPSPPRRYAYDSYVPPRSAPAYREDYPNVYRPNVYRPDPSAYYSRSPSPDRYSASRHSDANWDRDSQWASSSKPLPSWQDRKPLPPSPTSALSRDRGRRDSMLATRMFEPADSWRPSHADRSHRSDVSKTPFITDRYSDYRPRDAKDAILDRPRNPYPGGDRYRPPQNYRDTYPPLPVRSEYDSYRPQYDDWPPEKSESLGSSEHGRRDSMSSSHGRSSGRYDAPRTSSSSTLPPLPASPGYRSVRNYAPRQSPDRGRRPVQYDDHLPYDSDSSSKGNNNIIKHANGPLTKSRSLSRSSVASTEHHAPSASVKPHVPLSDLSGSVPLQDIDRTTVPEGKTQENEKPHVEKSPVSVKNATSYTELPSTAAIAPNEIPERVTAIPDTARSPTGPGPAKPAAETDAAPPPVSSEPKTPPKRLEVELMPSSLLSVPLLSTSTNEQASPLSPVPLQRSATEDTIPLSPTVKLDHQTGEPEKPRAPSPLVVAPPEDAVPAITQEHPSLDTSIASSRVSSPPTKPVDEVPLEPVSEPPSLPKPSTPTPASVPALPASPKPPPPAISIQIVSPILPIREASIKSHEPPTPAAEKPRPSPTPLPELKPPVIPKVVVTGPRIPEASELPDPAEVKTHADALRLAVMTRLLCDRQTREDLIHPVLYTNHSIPRRFPFEFRPGNQTAAVKRAEDLVEQITAGRKHEETMTNSGNVRKTLVQKFEERQAKVQEKAAKLREEYLVLHEKWKAHCAALDEQAKAAAAAEAAEHPQQNSGRTTRRSAANLGDAVRSDLEMEQIIASLGNDEATNPNQLSLKNLAVVPDMISVMSGKVDYVFDDTNHRVHNPSEYYELKTGIHDWTEVEKEIFVEKFAAYPKQFGIIASFLPNKSASQCVYFYYLHKKRHIDFRKVVQLLAPNKRRRKKNEKKKEKGNGLIADIRQHDDEVHRDDAAATSANGANSNGNNGNNGAPTSSGSSTNPATAVNGRPTRSRKQSSLNSGSAPTVNGTGSAASNANANQNPTSSNGAESKKPGWRRGTVNLEGTPNSTPTPEPEQQTPLRSRRRRVPASANKTAVVQEDQQDEDPTDQDQRPAKRQRRSRKVKSASHVNDEPDAQASTPQTPSQPFPGTSSFPNSSNANNTIITSNTKGTEPTVANNDANNVGGSNPNNGNSSSSGPTIRRRVAPTTVTWSDEDKKTFLSLLAQYGDDFKRIAASMPNKTTIQVQNYYKYNLVELDLERVAAGAPKRSPTPENTHNAPNYQRLFQDAAQDARNQMTELPFRGSLPLPVATRTTGSSSFGPAPSPAPPPHHQIHENPRPALLPPPGHALSQPQMHHQQLQSRPQHPHTPPQHHLQQPFNQQPAPAQHPPQAHAHPLSSSLIHSNSKPPSSGAILPRLPELDDPKLAGVGPGHAVGPGVWPAPAGGSSTHRSPPLKPAYDPPHGSNPRMRSPPIPGLTHGRSHLPPPASTSSGHGSLVSPPNYPAPAPISASHIGPTQPPHPYSSPRHGHVNPTQPCITRAIIMNPAAILHKDNLRLRLRHLFLITINSNNLNTPLLQATTNILRIHIPLPATIIHPHIPNTDLLRLPRALRLFRRLARCSHTAVVVVPEDQALTVTPSPPSPYATATTASVISPLPADGHAIDSYFLSSVL
ncbi:hypothetical protein AX16_005726 [Volvariella volvacea WC 439]|nr:hypothetical protein AX16_005726 [Volvariella volvacea WC 439]